jgi:hypothetical protein
MTGSEPKHLDPNEAAGESREAQSAWIGGGRAQPILSASMFAAANEGSRDRRHPLLWAAAWVGGFVIAITAFILIVR